MNKNVLAVICCVMISISLIVSMYLLGQHMATMANTLSAGFSRISINNSSTSPSSAKTDSPFLNERDAAAYVGMEYNAFVKLIQTGVLKGNYTTYEYQATEGVEVKAEDGTVRVEERMVTYRGYIFAREKLRAWMFRQIEEGEALN